MPKNTKSSASSATRKKKAAKAAKKSGPDGPADGSGGAQAKPQRPKQRGQKKDKSKKGEPRKKVYIPPQKPKADIVDPLDSQGLAALLPSDLVVLLRKASKKDVVTRIRALEGLTLWVKGETDLQASAEEGGASNGKQRVQDESEADEGNRQAALVIALPCWAFLFPRLAVSPNRRLRQLTAQLHSLLMSDAHLSGELFAQPQLVEQVVGHMLSLAHGPDRLVSRIAKTTWETHTTWASIDNDAAEDTAPRLCLRDYTETLASHLETLIYHEARSEGAGVSDGAPHMNGKGNVATSAAVAAALNTSRDAKNRDDVNVEEDLEATDARLCAAALGSLAWIISSDIPDDCRQTFESLLEAPTTWSSLSTFSVENAERTLGPLSPNVRVAGWHLLRAVLAKRPDMLQRNLGTIGISALEGAFLETDANVAQSMREALVGLVRAEPSVWKLDGDKDDNDRESDDGASDSGSETSSEGGDDEETAGGTSAKGEIRKESFPFFEAFLAYLQSGLRGITPSYDILIVLLASMPADVLLPTGAAAEQVLRSMYSAFDEGAIEGRLAQRAFLSAFLECLVWMAGRSRSLTSVTEAEAVAKLVQLPWCDLLDPTVDQLAQDSGSIPDIDARIAVIGEERLVSDMAMSLRKLQNIDASLSKPLLSLAQQSLSHAVVSKKRPADVICSILEKAVQDKPTQVAGLQDSVSLLVQDVMGVTSNIVASGEANVSGLEVMTLLISKFPSAHDEHNRKVAKMVFERIISQQAADSTDKGTADERAAFLVAYALLVTSEGRRATWQTILASLVHNGKVDWSALRATMRTSDEHLRIFRGLEGSPLDDAILATYADNTSLIGRLVTQPAPFITSATVHTILESVAKQPDSTQELDIFKDWLRADPSHVEDVFTSSMAGAVPSIFAKGILQGDAQSAATWKLLSHHSKSRSVALQSLRDEILQTTVDVKSIVEAAQSMKPAMSLDDILPGKDAMMQYFSSACAAATPSTLSIFDPLVAVAEKHTSSTQQYDQAGLSVYARCCTVLAFALEDDAKREAWKLPHLVITSIAANDVMQETKGGPSLFENAAAALDLHELAPALSASLLSRFASRLPDRWSDAVLSLAQGKSSNIKDDFLQVLQDLYSTTGAERCFSQLLKGALRYGSASESDLQALLRSGQAAERTRPGMARAVYLAVRGDAVDTALHDRLRNQTAAELAGVKAAQVPEKGLQLLRTLIDLAPPSESSALLIPQQRCIFLLQAIQGWIASDESADYEPEIYTRLSQLFVHVLPIVQEMAGSHLDLIIDTLEMQLADARTSSNDDIVQLYFALQLFETMEDLQRRSAVLRDAWRTRSADVYDAVRQIILGLAGAGSAKDGSTASAGRGALKTLLADAGQTLPPATFRNDIDSLTALLQDEQPGPLQIYAYRILAFNIREHVKELVVEAAVRSKDAQETDDDKLLLEPQKEVRMPSGLVESMTGSSTNALCYLLSWLTAFEYFEESSIDLRAAFTSQLQTTHAIERHLLPFVYARLSPTSDPSRWAIDEVFLDDIDATQETSIEVLALHVLYRALIHVPNLVREAFLSLKDRQQSMQLKALVTRHLSPLLSQREFGHLREQSVLDRLQDENMQIRVAANASEVIATYTIDEHPLEIGISMPNDYPLRPIEVRDIRNVGISEGTWRAWILGIRQLIAGRNGLVFDALLLFKRNVEAKFSGFDEDSTCSICYSIVSPTDHSLPTKPCKTCKKKFHASCLYKWVSTSGSSTCPMCRSIL